MGNIDWPKPSHTPTPEAGGRVDRKEAKQWSALSRPHGYMFVEYTRDNSQHEWSHYDPQMDEWVMDRQNHQIPSTEKKGTYLY